MEEPQRIDLTYITERIITIFCPPECPEDIYLQNLQEILLMLQSKHGHKYMLINLSQKNDSLTRMNHKLLDTGWVDLLAPDLNQIFSVCTTMENWLQTHPNHVLVLHCRGGKGGLGVLVASYIHFSNMSASADLSLDHFALRRFYNDKLSTLMTPSEKRSAMVQVNNNPIYPPVKRQHNGATKIIFIHHVNAAQTDRLYFVLQPAQLLKGDIMVVCYDKNSRSSSRQVVFRLQFHTGLVQGHTLTFFKADLDCASQDPRFPEDGKVELLLSDSPEKIQAPPQVLGPGNACLYARVRKKSSEEGLLFSLTTNSPNCSERTPSASSDSGLSVASQGRTGAGHKSGPAWEKSAQIRKLVTGLDFEIAQPLLEVMAELAANGERGVSGNESEFGLTVNGEALSGERETDILDDEDEIDGEAASAVDLPSSSSICSLSSDSLPGTQTEYSTQSWVQQQQVDVITEKDPAADGGQRLSRVRKERPPPLVAPDAPSRGTSSREAVQRGTVDKDGTQNTHVMHNVQSLNNTHMSSCEDDDLASLTTDIDESIEQLNQLILDLDPTFIPVPTRCAPLSRSASLHTNGLSHKGDTHQSGKTTENTQRKKCGKVCQTHFYLCSISNPLYFLFHSSTPPSGWHDRTPNSQNSPYPPQPSPPLSLSTPNAHSSPRGALKGLGGGLGVHRETDSIDLSSLLLGNGLDHSLLKAVEGLGGLNLGGHGGLPPLLPEKRRGEGGELGSQSPSLSGFSSPHSGSSLSIPFSSPMTPDPFRGFGGVPSPGAEFGSKQDTVKFVQDTSKFWYKPDISRDQAIAVLKDKEPGSFVVRDSHSFRGAYGLAMKVATPPPSVIQQSKKGDLSNELVRHFLIECTQKGVRLKGCPNEPYFGSLTALVCQHSITPLALPCKLILPDRDPVEDLNDSSAQTSTNSAAELLKQGAACNVWYLGSVSLESLTGHQAVQKATTQTLSMDPPPASTVVHFKVSAQGITLTDNQRKLFFRRHYTVNTVIFCSLDPQGRKIFGFVARKSQSETENMCHLFAEHDPEQPASAIVNFVSKVMIGSHKK
uniref:Tensin 3 n=1 Tax=Sparus aurata TaxID=8175 RepID=A0A671W463_SPAAU